MAKHSVLFVCLGNICRSPMAEMVFKEIIREKGIEDQWKVDSAGTAAYHIGDKPDKRSIQTCKNHYPKLEVTHRGRQVKQSDFFDFEYMLTMDESNMRDLKSICPKNATTKLKLLGSYDPKGMLIIEDPYYGGMDGFEVNFQQVTRSCLELLKEAN
eukprot:TRINITY_DN260_c0_g1_i4.p1 TRINITY_DN260_c0_g1~~TRINITY_DN260_c0_g1_i4.p1  ORF type:complete len:181 (-),score=39.93 TRINITY_DN260_c0_g1_i4:89-556(-)